MGFLDVLEDVGRGIAAVATCGLSEVAIRASGALDSVSNTGESVGVAVGVLADTAQKVGTNLSDLLEDVDQELIKNSDGSPGELTKTITTVNQTLNDLDDLLVIQRITARSDSELWPEEKLRIKAIDAELQNVSTAISNLEKNKKQLVDTLKGLKIPDSKFIFIELEGTDAEKMIDELAFNSPEDIQNCLTIFSFYHYPNLGAVRTCCDALGKILKQQTNLWSYEGNLYKERDHILYNEPGVIPCTLNNVNEILARFNSIQQPMIEDILDSVDEGVEETVGILKGVRTLFVETKQVPREMTQMDVAHRDWLLSKQAALEVMTQKEYNLSNKLMTTIGTMTPNLQIIREEN